jgi:hypothetical protein
MLKLARGIQSGVFESEEAANAFFSSSVFQQQIGKIREFFVGPPMREIFEVRVHF